MYGTQTLSPHAPTQPLFSVNLAPLGTSCRGRRASGLASLAYFTPHNVLEARPCCRRVGIPFLFRLSDSPPSGWTTFRVSTICRWTRGLLPALRRCDSCCRERGVPHLFTSAFAPAARGHGARVSPAARLLPGERPWGETACRSARGQPPAPGCRVPCPDAPLFLSPFGFCLPRFLPSVPLPSACRPDRLLLHARGSPRATLCRAHPRSSASSPSLRLLSREGLKSELVKCHRCPVDQSWSEGSHVEFSRSVCFVVCLNSCDLGTLPKLKTKQNKKHPWGCTKLL